MLCIGLWHCVHRRYCHVLTIRDTPLLYCITGASWQEAMNSSGFSGSGDSFLFSFLDCQGPTAVRVWRWRQQQSTTTTSTNSTSSDSHRRVPKPGYFMYCDEARGTCTVYHSSRVFHSIACTTLSTKTA
jgi:hypothetical protein